MLVTPNANLRQALLHPLGLLIGSRTMREDRGRPLKYLRQAGLATIYCVNARRDTVLASAPTRRRRVPRRRTTPNSVPTEGVIDAVAECGHAGVKVATILARASPRRADAWRASSGCARSRRDGIRCRPSASAWSTCATDAAHANARLPNRIFGRPHLLCLA